MSDTNQSHLNNFYWGLEISQPALMSYQKRLKDDQIFHRLTFILAIIGLISLLFYLIFNAGLADHLYFFFHHSFFLLFFYFTLLIDLFLFKRWITQALNANKIKNLLTSAVKHQTQNIEISPAFEDKFWGIMTFCWQRKQVKAPNQPLTLLDFFYEYVSSPYFTDLAQRLNVDLKSLRQSLNRQLENLNQSSNSQQPQFLKSLDQHLVKSFEDAFQAALKNNLNEVDLITIAEYIYRNSPLLQEIFFAFDVDQEEFYGCLRWMKINRRLQAQMSNYHQSARFKVTGDMNSAYTASSTPILNEFSQDLTIAAQQEDLPLCVGRDQELNNVLQAFKSGQNGLILVGPPQVGKKTIIDGLAQLMVEEKVPTQLQDKRLVALDMTKLLGGTDNQESQKRLVFLLKEVKKSGNIVLFIDNINAILREDTTVGQTDQLGFDFLKILTEAIISKEIQFITTCDDQIYNRYLEKQPLGQNLLKIVIEEPDIKSSIMMLQTKTMALENKHQIRFSYDCLHTAVTASKRYLNERYLPQKAIEIIELAAVIAQERCQHNNTQTCVCGIDDALAVISQLTKIPLQKVSSEESEVLINLEAKLHQQVIGQNEAVNAVANALRRARTNLQNDNKPLASFLFLGPTGVGKTELSKTVAKTYFGDENAMIRLDMSEYQLPSDVVKMIGDPHGAVGYLTEAVHKKPYSLILFDEIEKAHRDILNLFLQLLDDGRLTNGQGQTINFSNTIIIATSNAGANYIHQAVGQGESNENIKKKLLNELLFEHFKPEFINRFDDVIVFRSLQLNEVIQIVQISLTQIKNNLQKKGIFLEIGPTAINKLAAASYDPQYGARPLKRFIKDKIESQIAIHLLENKLKRRDKIIINDELKLEIIKAIDL